MAHSIETYHGKHVLLNDGDLFVVIALALKLLPVSPGIRDLRELEEMWRQSMGAWGPGCIDLQLETLIKTPSQRQSLNTLLDAVKQEILTFGDSIPAEVLNKMLPPEAISFQKSYDAKRGIEAVDQLQQLIV